MSGPKISGFSMVRHGEKFEYPYLQAYESLLPWVDELVLNIGKCEDDTLKKIQQFQRAHPQSDIKILESEWPLRDPKLQGLGLVLSEQTNIALEKCQYDWCLHVQADEVLHEDDRAHFQNTLEQMDLTPSVEGILFDYIHFYGDYSIVQETRSAYRREVRAFKRSSLARSVGDAQSFRKPDGSKLRVVRTGTRIFHYGWVRPPEAMKQKTFFMDQLYHGVRPETDAHGADPQTGTNYRYKKFWGLKPFRATHPQVMRERIAQKKWRWDFKNSPYVFSARDLKKVFSDLIEKATDWRPFEYKSYELIGTFLQPKSRSL